MVHEYFVLNLFNTLSRLLIEASQTGKEIYRANLDFKTHE